MITDTAQADASIAPACVAVCATGSGKTLLDVMPEFLLWHYGIARFPGQGDRVRAVLPAFGKVRDHGKAAMSGASLVFVPVCDTHERRGQAAARRALPNALGKPQRVD
jgi:hypothetical protein